MLQSVEIRNFQALHQVDLELTPFTVIVGPSSSGKSAFVRALHTLVNNRRGLDFVTHGERLMSIKATTERGTVVMRRGKSTDDNDYVIIPTGDPKGQKRYTKLNANVPPEVSEFLGIHPGPGPFAGQHDMPYMLNDSGSAVATALGRLTNVNVIFDAARESKRQATSTSSTLKVKAADLEAIKKDLPKYAPIQSQLANLEEAEKKISEAYSLRQQINRIEQAQTTLIAAASAVNTLRKAAHIVVPDLSPALSIYEQHQRLTQARTALIEAATAIKGVKSTQAALEEQASAVRTELEDELKGLSSEFASRFEGAESSYQDAKGTYLLSQEAADIAAQTVEGLLA